MDDNKAKTVTNIIITITFIVIIVAGGLIALFTYWTTALYDVLSVNSPVPVETKTVRAGQPIILAIDYCKKLDVRGTVTWEIDSKVRRVFLPVSPETGPVTCQKGLRIPILIPTGLIPDTYYLQWNVTYRVNPIRTVNQQFRTQNFQVVK